MAAKKVFLLYDLKSIIPKIRITGIENHEYPLKFSNKLIKNKLYLKNYYDLQKFKNNHFDLVIAFNSIYMQNLGDTIKTISQIQKFPKKATYLYLLIKQAKIEINF